MPIGPRLEDLSDFDISDLRRTRLEVERRPLRIKPISVIDYTPTDPDQDYQLALPGTVTVFLTRQGASLTSELLSESVLNGKDGSDQEIAKNVAESVLSRRLMSFKEAVSVLPNQPSICDIIHGQTTVVQNATIPKDADFATYGLPYNGGSLSSSGLKLLEYYNPENDEPLEAMALRHLPPLSEAESIALKQIPDDISDINIGPYAACYAVCGITIAMTVAAVTMCGPSAILGARVHVSDELAKSQDPVRTARQLLSLRRNLLEGNL